MENPRKTALDALIKVNQNNGYSNIVLNAALKQANLNKTDSAFAGAVFYGVLERKLTLDYCIAAYSKSAKKIPAEIKEILRMGAYQILYMSRVPDSAAVNESVRLAKSSRQSHSSGFVNAVLRNISRDKDNLLNFSDDTPEGMSVKYSAPVWLVNNLIADYGKEKASKFLESSFDSPPVYIKVNTAKISAEQLLGKLREQDISANRTILPDALRLENPGSLENNPLFKEGLFFVEDLASQLSVEVLDPREGESVLDLCAAPGGKSFAGAVKMNNRGRVVSCDLYESRCGLIDEGKTRLGLDIIETKCNDAAEGAPEGQFDRVLCDVPCSGIGIIRRKPDIKYKDPEGLKQLPVLGLKILENGAAAVKPGGRLVYSTCTLRCSENEKVVERFLKLHTDFQQVEIHFDGVRPATDDKSLTLMPQFNDTDGFFVAAFTRTRK